MKFLSLFTFISLFCFISLNAQFTTVTGKASVNLIAPLSINAVSGNLDFGEIILTGSKQIEKINPRNGQLFQITGHPKKYVTISFGPTQLDNAQWVNANGGVVGKIIFKPDVELDDGSKLASGDSARLHKDGAIGKLNVRVGGSINIRNNQPQGDYIGLFVISVSY